tara:strand:+ start:443 stop:631 length:189 start_codon:yes stop_codon:yes gene_type:complete
MEATVTKQCEWCDKQYKKGANDHPNFHDLGICSTISELDEIVEELEKDLEEQVRLAKVTLDI